MSGSGTLKLTKSSYGLISSSNILISLSSNISVLRALAVMGSGILIATLSLKWLQFTFYFYRYSCFVLFASICSSLIQSFMQICRSIIGSCCKIRKKSIKLAIA